MQFTSDTQALAVQRRELGDEPNLGMARRVDEVGRPKVLIASGVVRVEAVCLDRQLDRWFRGEVQRPVIALEPAFDRLQAIKVADVELDARTLGVDPPSGVLESGLSAGLARMVLISVSLGC